ncbi:MAG: hypothetical protein GY801_17225 [bacterium]|nr:hypothetical protein [bacterium]
MGYAYSLQKKSGIIARKLGIEELAAGKHHGFTIEYVWMFTGNWKKNEQGTTCYACGGSGKELMLPRPVELHAWNDTFYDTIRSTEHLPCIVTTNYDTVDFFLVTPEETHVFFVPLSEDATIRQLVEAADGVAREFLARTKN